MAQASQRKTASAWAAGFFADEITPVVVPQKKDASVTVNRDEQPRETSLDALAKL